MHRFRDSLLLLFSSSFRFCLSWFYWRLYYEWSRERLQYIAVGENSLIIMGWYFAVFGCVCGVCGVCSIVVVAPLMIIEMKDFYSYPREGSSTIHFLFVLISRLDFGWCFWPSVFWLYNLSTTIFFLHLELNVIAWEGLFKINLDFWIRTILADEQSEFWNTNSQSTKESQLSTNYQAKCFASRPSVSQNSNHRDFICLSSERAQ